MAAVETASIVRKRKIKLSFFKFLVRAGEQFSADTDVVVRVLADVDCGLPVRFFYSRDEGFGSRAHEFMFGASF